MTKGRLGRLSNHTGHNASKRRAGLETHNAEADSPLKRGRLPAVGKRATRAPTGSAGVLGGGMYGRGDWTQHGKPCRWRGTRQPTAREGQVGPTGWRRGPQYQGSRVMPVEGRDLSSRAAHDGGRDMRTGESLTASERVQRLQTALHARRHDLVREPDAGNLHVRLCVQLRLVCSAGVSPARVKVRSSVAWMAGWRETKALKPIDKAIYRVVSESLGRNANERRSGLESAKPRRPSLQP